MGLQAAVHLGHMPWALTKEEEEEPFSAGLGTPYGHDCIYDSYKL
jgi:hypothetical protein